MVIFNKELNMDEIKKIRSYLYYKYTNNKTLPDNMDDIGPRRNNEHAILHGKYDENFLIYDPRLQSAEPLHFSEGELEGERGKSLLFKNLETQNPKIQVG